MLHAEIMRAEIEGARTFAQMDELSRQLWRGHGAGALSDGEAQGLAEHLHGRRSAIRDGMRPLPIPGLVGAGLAIPRTRLFPPRKIPRSPDRMASRDRRRLLACSGPLPPRLAARFTEGQRAVLRIVADAVAEAGLCDLCLDAIAARAGVCRRLAQGALRLAAGDGLLTIEERRYPARRAPAKAGADRVQSPARHGEGSLFRDAFAAGTGRKAAGRAGPGSSPGQSRLSFRVAAPVLATVRIMMGGAEAVNDRDRAPQLRQPGRPTQALSMMLSRRSARSGAASATIRRAASMASRPPAAKASSPLRRMAAWKAFTAGPAFGWLSTAATRLSRASATGPTASCQDGAGEIGSPGGRAGAEGAAEAGTVVRGRIMAVCSWARTIGPVWACQTARHSGWGRPTSGSPNKSRPAAI